MYEHIVSTNENRTFFKIVAVVLRVSRHIYPLKKEQVLGVNCFLGSIYGINVGPSTAADGQCTVCNLSIKLNNLPKYIDTTNFELLDNSRVT